MNLIKKNLFFGLFHLFLSANNPEEQILKKLLKKNDVVFDVGANVGDWTQMAFNACREVKVFAFEPIPIVFNQLNGSFSNNNFNCYNFGLSNINSKKETFCFYKNFSALSGLYYRENIGVSEEPIRIDVELMTLDQFCLINDIHQINFLKIDTEGNEKKVLLGASQILEERGVIYLQFEYGGTYLDAGTTLKEVYSYLRNFGYKLYKIESKGLTLMNEWSDDYEDYQYSNILASLLEIKELNY